MNTLSAPTPDLSNHPGVNSTTPKPTNWLPWVVAALIVFISYEKWGVVGGVVAVPIGGFLAFWIALATEKGGGI